MESQQNPQKQTIMIALEIRRAQNGAFTLESVLTNGRETGKALVYAGNLDGLLSTIKESFPEKPTLATADCGA